LIDCLEQKCTRLGHLTLEEKLKICEEHGVELAKNSEGETMLPSDHALESLVDDSEYELTSSDRQLDNEYRWRDLWDGIPVYGKPGFVDEHRPLFHKHFGLDVWTSSVRLETEELLDWPYSADRKLREAVVMYLTVPNTKSRAEKWRPLADDTVEADDKVESGFAYRSAVS